MREFVVACSSERCWLLSATLLQSVVSTTLLLVVSGDR